LNRINQIEQETAVQEMGWTHVRGLWVNPACPDKKFALIGSVLLYEWRQAMRRAGKAEYEFERQDVRHFRHFIVWLLVTVIAVLVALGHRLL